MKYGKGVSSVIGFYEKQELLNAPIIVEERTLRQKQSICLRGRLLHFVRNDHYQTLIEMKHSLLQKQSLTRWGNGERDTAITGAGGEMASQTRYDVASYNTLSIEAK